MSDKMFMTISETVAATGFSKRFIRTGIKNGTIPFIKSGNRFLINVPRLIEDLDNQSMKRKTNEQQH